ncbi:unnamed protein product, partial [Prorocentrum cordatum]
SFSKHYRLVSLRLYLSFGVAIMATGGAAAASGEDKSNGGNIPVPVFDGTSKTMKKYRREVATWQIGTEVKPPKQGATLPASLKGKAEEACEELDLDAIKGDDSVKVFLEYLGKRFPEIAALETPALLETFVRPACVRHKYEEIRDYSNRFNGIATKLKAKGIQVPDEVLADLYIKGARLPPERAASVLNGVGNQFNPTKIQEQLMINLPKVSVVDGNKDSHDKGGYGGHKNKDHKRAYATETYEEDRRAELDGASSDSFDDYEDELPDELQDVIDEAEEQVAFLTKIMVRAKDKLKEAKQARGYFAKRDGGNLPKRDDPKIAKMKCSKKNDPNAKADIPKKGSNRTNIATHDTSDAQEPHVAEMTVAAVYQQDQRAAVRDRKYSALHSIDWTQIRQAAELPEEVTAAAFFINKDHQCLMAATSSALIYLSVEDLLKESGGKLTFDTACARCVGGLDWHNDIKKRLAAFNIQPIEYPEKEPFRFGASKVAFSLKAALIPCSVNGKAFTVRMGIVRSAVPGLFSRKAQSELDIVYHAGDNKLDIKSIDEHNIQMGLRRAGHPTLDITGFTPNYKPVLDVSDTKAEIRLHPCASYHAETAVASAAKPVVPEARHPGVASEADESPLDTDCNALDRAELFEQQVRQETSPGGSGQNLPTTSTARLPAISSMRMPELQAEVASYDLDVRDATCDQLRVILRALRAEGRESTPQDDYIPGLGKKNKGDLQQLCRDHQIEFDQRTPAPELRQRLKGWKVEDTVSSAAATVAHPSSQITGADKMRFGKYPTADYRCGRVKAHGVPPLPPEKAKTTLEAVMAEEVVLDDEWVAPAATTTRASGSQGSWAGHRRQRPPEPHEMDTSDMGLEKAGETDKEDRPRGIKKGKRVGLLYQVTGLLSAFAFQTVLTADVKEAYSVRSHRVDVMQVFGGEGGITEAAWKRRMTATEVIDRKYGWDLRKQKDLDATYDLYYASRPKFVTIELPCQAGAPTDLEDGAAVPSLARDLFKYQLDSGDMAMIENPATSRPWTQRAILELLADERVYQVRRDMCEYGARHYKTGGLIKHPAKLLVTHEEFEQLKRTCSRKHHDQTFGDNVAVRKSGVYPAKFCRAAVRIVEQVIRQQGGHRAYQVDCQSHSSPFIVTVPREQATAYVNDTAPLGETGEPDGDPDPMGGGDDFADTHDVRAEDTVDGRIGVGAITFTKKAAACCKPAKLAMLKRLHVNLGHPSNEDLGRSLRLKGAKSATAQAVKELICGACRSQQRPSARRPAHLHFVQDFGDDVGFDCFELKDVDGKSYWYFSIVDLATTFHVATLIDRQTSQAFAAAFERTIEHSSIRGEDEMRTLAIMVSGAKNSLRRMQNDDQLRRAMLARARTVATPLSVGEMCYVFRQVKKKEQREQHNRNAKKGIWRGPCVVIGHHSENTWVSLGGHTMLVAPEHIKALAPDDVWFRNGWGEIGQAVAELNRARDSLEQEEAQVEDIRPAPGEPEVKPDEMEQAWREFIDNPDDSDLELNVSEDPPQQEQIQVLPADVPQQSEEEQTYGPDEFRRRRATFDGVDSGDFGPAFKRLQTEREHAGSGALPARATSRDRAAAPDQEAAAGPEAGGARQRSRSAPSQALQTSIVTERIKRKQADKEIHWRAIKDSDRELFREAAAKQWSEWQKYGSCQVLSIEESEAIRGMIKPSLILPSRFVYRDKNTPLRTDKHPLPVKAKARLCVGGHMDPRLAQGDLRTDAPTDTRNSTMLFFTICQRFDLEIYAADVEAAFMQGDEQPDQQLHMAQPREGLPGLNPKQLIKILKGVFGLATAPRQWWAKLKRKLLAVEEKLSDNYAFRLHQHSLDPALYYGYDQHGELCAVVVAHVDDLLLGISRKYPGLYDRLHKLLPWGDWRGLPFTFCGKQAWRDQEEVLHLRQTEYANTIEEIPLSKERKTDLSSDATPAEFSDNRSALGALGWLSSQTRPDLAAGVAMGQRTQNKPTIQDLLETNRLIKLAWKHADVG